MKLLYAFLCLSLSMAGLTSCMDRATAVRTSLSGIYVKEIKDEFSVGVDTIQISLVDLRTGLYSVRQKTSYQQTIDEKTFPPKRVERRWLMFYNADRNQLVDDQHKAFTVLEDGAILSTGAREYRKVLD